MSQSRSLNGNEALYNTFDSRCRIWQDLPLIVPNFKIEPSPNFKDLEGDQSYKPNLKVMQ